MKSTDLTSSYQLIAELLLPPDEREQERIMTFRAGLGPSLSRVDELIAEFIARPESWSSDEFVPTLELAPSCPLYLGAHMFDEPSTCNGVGSSGRNAYMLELIGLYLHFNLDQAGGELPDFLPVMVDFLWISLQTPARDQVALRRWCLERHVIPALEPLSESLAKYESPYQLIVSALRETAEEDVRRMGDTPAWRAPGDDDHQAVSLPVLSESEDPLSAPEPQLSHSDFRP